MQTIRTEIINHWVTVSFETDRLTDPYTVDRFNAVLETITDGLQQRGRVAINFDGVDSVSSQVIGVLMKLRERIQKKNGELVLCKLNDRVKDLMKVINVAQLFKYSDKFTRLIGGTPRRVETIPLNREGEVRWMD